MNGPLDKSLEVVFSYEAPEASPGFMLWQTTVLWQRLIKKTLEPFELSHAQFVVMAILLWFREAAQQAAQSDLVQASKLDKMTVSKALKELVARGYVMRQENPRDSRAKCVQLAEEGRVLITKIVPLVERADEDFFARLSADERMHVLGAFKRLSG
ncbi:MAG TPA: MarR family transcriptional regulator [Opitutales bacterium]|nr:MarR family transcriptional regulator [Opitutales bacterium]